MPCLHILLVIPQITGLLAPDWGNACGNKLTSPVLATPAQPEAGDRTSVSLSRAASGPTTVLHSAGLVLRWTDGDLVTTEPAVA